MPARTASRMAGSMWPTSVVVGPPLLTSWPGWFSRPVVSPEFWVAEVCGGETGGDDDVVFFAGGEVFDFEAEARR